MLRSRLIGVGSYLPEKVVSNDDLSKIVDTSDEWIYERTGIKRRHILSEEESTSTISLKAAKQALSMSGLTGRDIDLIILATATPDKTFPATAAIIQRELGSQGSAFDIQAACSGFLYAMTIADSMLKNRQAKTALVIGAESLSRITNWKDRNTCVLFGDGSGAAIFRAEESKENIEGFGIYDMIIRSDGNQFDLLCSSGGAATSEDCGKITMNGREVYRHAVTNLTAIAEEILTRNNLSHKDLDWFVPHQANMRIIESVVQKIGISMDKVILTIEDTANTSAASIPIALTKGFQEGKIKEGDLILLDAMGGGFTWAAGLLRV